jgi:histidinol dehydrogenase
MKIIKYPKRQDWEAVLKRPAQKFKKIEKIITPILKKVKRKGDMALIQYNLEYDHVELDTLLVSQQEFEESHNLVSEELKSAIQTARENIEKFHAAQKDNGLEMETMEGVLCSRRSVPISRVGLYVPGGTAPLFSTVLMLGVPAKIAGCEEIVICTPANHEGKINPAILYTADLIGINKIAKVGGAQAIAAMAYGTESVPKVYKIFGPGNQYVTAAKQVVSKRGVAIDMPAGPSEVAVYADHTAVPAFVAADLLSQAEHGVDSQVILVTDNEELIKDVAAELVKQLEALPRQVIARKALENSRVILVHDEDEAVELLNEYGAEHLILAVANADAVAGRISNAGSVFIGNYTPESAGDYASGTNHTLPTNGYAKAFSGVSLDSFMKKITFQKISQEGIRRLGPTIEVMADAEQLQAHKEAVSIRLKYLNENV